MKVKFKEAVDVYPDGITRQSVQADEVCDFAPDYAQLMIEKGHAEAVADAAPAVTENNRGRK